MKPLVWDAQRHLVSHVIARARIEGVHLKRPNQRLPNLGWLARHVYIPLNIDFCFRELSPYPGLRQFLTASLQYQSKLAKLDDSGSARRRTSRRSDKERESGKAGTDFEKRNRSLEVFRTNDPRKALTIL